MLQLYHSLGHQLLQCLPSDLEPLHCPDGNNVSYSYWQPICILTRLPCAPVAPAGPSAPRTPCELLDHMISLEDHIIYKPLLLFLHPVPVLQVLRLVPMETCYL